MATTKNNEISVTLATADSSVTLVPVLRQSFDKHVIFMKMIFVVCIKIWRWNN
jgi:hypothetical protein